ncbi:MAG TPA: STAS domain-containing protein [Nocardioidaceae bacterium]|nr:STAS domain-containing protein [Nocardioidaceae bacterium]
MSSYDVGLEARDGVVVVTLTGEFDLSQSSALEAQLRSAMLDDPPFVVVDFAAATFLDSTALGVLVGAAKEAADRSGWLRLACAENRAVRRILELTQLDSAFGLYEAVDDAIKTQRPTGTAYEQTPSGEPPVTPEV